MTPTTLWIERLRKHEDGTWRWSPEAENFWTDEDFKINDANIDAELCKIGQLMARYGSLAAELNANLARKEEELKYTAALVTAALRSQAEQNGTKMTVDALKEATITSVEYQTALAPLHLLRAEAERAEHWWRSISAKAQALNSLTYWRGAEMRRT